MASLVENPFQRLDPEGLMARLLVAFLATAGLFYVNILPALVDGLVKGVGYSSARAGGIASANIYGAALGALLIVPFVKRVRWRSASAALLVMLILIDAVSAATRVWGALLAMRFLHGLIGGALVGIGFAVIGRMRAPDRSFGMLLVVQFGVGGIALAGLPVLTRSVGVIAPFLALAAFSAFTLGLLPFVPDYRVARHTDGILAPTLRAAFAPVWRALAAVFLFQAANTCLAAYVVGLGDMRGVSAGQIGLTLALANWLGAAASGAVVALGTRHGRVAPLAIGFALALVGTTTFWISGTPEVTLAAYVTANLVTAACWAFVLPFLFGLCVVEGGDDRLAALTGLCSKLGLATGPAVGAAAIGAGEYERLAAMMVAGLVLSGAIALKAAAKRDLSEEIHP